MLVAFISPVRVSRIVFRCEIYCEVSVKLYYKNNFCHSLLLKSLEIRLFYRKLNNRKRGNSLRLFHRSSLNTVTFRGKLD